MAGQSLLPVASSAGGCLDVIFLQGLLRRFSDLSDAGRRVLVSMVRPRGMQARQAIADGRVLEGERAMALFPEQNPFPVLRIDEGGRLLYANQAAVVLLEEWDCRVDLCVPAVMGEAVTVALSTGKMQKWEAPVNDRWFLFALVPFVESHYANLYGQDITERKRAEEDLRLAASVFHNSTEGVVITDAAGVILSVNPSFTEITGYTEEEALGRNPRMLRSDQHGMEFYRSMWQSLLTDGRWQGEIWNRRKGGEVYLEWLTINRIDNDRGVPDRYVSVFHDITEMRMKDERIRHLAFHDALTGLPNRSLIMDRLQHALARARREGGRLSVTFVDLDRFKAVNDTLGHDVGDLLLQEVARRIQGRLRSMDTVARLGGDEFVVLMEDLSEVGDCACLAQDLITEIAQPLSLRGHAVEIGASMGMAFFPEDGADAIELMKRADMAMYAAKSEGRNTFRFFQPAMLQGIQKRLSLESELRLALAGNGLELHYQPCVDLTTREVMYVEALLRWPRPGGPVMGPAEFIPIAEESGLILELGHWVLNEACRQVAAWKALGRNVRVAVNVSMKQLEHASFVTQVTGLIERYQICPRDLEIELTETTVMAHPEKAASLLTNLRKLGLTIAVDDFGTGYSSLAYLRRLPIDVLKIDGSFVRNIDTEEGDAEIARTIVALGQTLKLTVVAEGVESGAQADLLQAIGCHIAQGYHFSRPLPPAELEEWLGKTSVAFPPQ